MEAQSANHRTTREFPGMQFDRHERQENRSFCKRTALPTPWFWPSEIAFGLPTSIIVRELMCTILSNCRKLIWGVPCLLPLTHSSRGKVGAGGAVVPSDHSPRHSPDKESYSLVNSLASDTLRPVWAVCTSLGPVFKDRLVKNFHCVSRSTKRKSQGFCGFLLNRTTNSKTKS